VAEEANEALAAGASRALLAPVLLRVRACG
jgi:hypothetical protein